jgi:hypothetical protein
MRSTHTGYRISVLASESQCQVIHPTLSWGQLPVSITINVNSEVTGDTLLPSIADFPIKEEIISGKIAVLFRHTIVTQINEVDLRGAGHFGKILRLLDNEHGTLAVVTRSH